jgi:uncharacterized cupredoxin-like copper-binding protein
MFGKNRRASHLAAVGIAGIALGLVAAGCGGSGSSADETTTTAAAPAATTTSETTETHETTETTETPPPPATASHGAQRISIVFKNGAVVGGLPHETVKQGDRVVIAVKADVTDEVHLHGYDIKRDVAPGKPARIAFKATIPGRFEAELESRSLQILDLEVRP